MGIANPFGVGLIAVCKPVQKVQNVIWGYLINLGITELLAEPIDDRPI